MIIQMNYSTKGRKYFMFEDIRKVGCLVDKVRTNFIYLFFFIFINLFNFFVQFFYANFILSSGFLNNKCSFGQTLL